MAVRKAKKGTVCVDCGKPAVIQTAAMWRFCTSCMLANVRQWEREIRQDLAKIATIKKILKSKPKKEK